MNETEALRDLDKIEQSDPDPMFDAGALKLMECVGETPEGLRLLVARYSRSPSENIVVYLALMLSLKSSSATTATAPLAFECAAQLEGSNNDGALVSILNAMGNQIAFGPGWGDSLYPPDGLFPFVAHCLNFNGRLHVLVKFGAIELVTTICWRGLLDTAFTPEQIKWISNRMDVLSLTDNTLIIDAGHEFRGCLSEKYGLDLPHIFSGDPDVSPHSAD